MFVRGRRLLKKFKKRLYLVKQFTSTKAALSTKSFINKDYYSFKSFDYTSDLTLFTKIALSYKNQKRANKKVKLHVRNSKLYQ